MASLNKCCFIGNLGKEPTIRYMPSGDPVANFSVACSDTFKDKNGQKQERTEWVNIVMFGKLAEIAGEYLQKGSQVYVEGRMQTRDWDKDGVKHYRTEVVADKMVMLGSPNRGDGRGHSDDDRRAPQQQRQPAPETAGGGSGFEDMEDDIPF